MQIGSAFAIVLNPTQIAEAIASGDRRTDTNSLLSSLACGTCHFCNRERTAAHMEEAVNQCNPYLFGYILHQAQDFYSHWNEGYHREHVTDDRLNPSFRTLRRDDFSEAHPDARAEILQRNPRIDLNQLSDDYVIDVYLRAEPSAEQDPNWDVKNRERDYYEFHTDEYFEGSQRETWMRTKTSFYIFRFMTHLVFHCCAVEWEDAVVQRAHGILTE
jgi:hypothetical protein